MVEINLLVWLYFLNGLSRDLLYCEYFYFIRSEVCEF